MITNGRNALLTVFLEDKTSANFTEIFRVIYEEGKSDKSL